jgi:hypothetical protein
LPHTHLSVVFICFQWTLTNNNNPANHHFHQPPSNHQPPTITIQPPTTNHHQPPPSTTNHHHPTTNHPPPQDVCIHDAVEPRLPQARQRIRLQPLLEPNPWCPWHCGSTRVPRWQEPVRVAREGSTSTSTGSSVRWSRRYCGGCGVDVVSAKVDPQRNRHAPLRGTV